MEKLTLDTTLEAAWRLKLITSRLHNCLRRAGLRTIRECIDLIETDKYYAIRGMGEGTLKEFQNFIKPFKKMLDTPQQKTFKDCLEILTTEFYRLQEENEKQKRVIEILIKDRIGKFLSFEESEFLKEALGK